LGNEQKAQLLRELGLDNELEFEKPYIYRNRNGGESVNLAKLKSYMKKNYIIRNFQGSFRIYENGYYRDCKIETLVYTELPERLQSNKVTTEVRKDFEIDEELVLKEEQLAPPKYICFKNGIYDIETKEIFDHTPNIIFLSRVPHNYKLNAPICEYTTKYIENCIGNDKNLKNLLFEIIGVTLSDVRCFKNWFFIQGRKDSGKSTYCGILQNLLKDVDGTKHYSAIPIYRLDDNEFDLHEILDKKLNVVTESDCEAIKSLTTIKKLTGGSSEELNCKVKYAKNTSTGVSKALLIFAGNSIPKVWTTGDKQAFLDRMILFNFDTAVAKEKQIPNLLEKLDYEYIIKLGIEALHRFVENNYIFTETEQIRKNREEVLETSDDIYSFVSSVCELKLGNNIHVAEAYNIFCYWCYENGLSEKATTNSISSKLFMNTIKNYGVNYSKSVRVGGNVNSGFTNVIINKKLIDKYNEFDSHTSYANRATGRNV
jgi:P4 family phage/plasmid primase-like protien